MREGVRGGRERESVREKEQMIKTASDVER